MCHYAIVILMLGVAIKALITANRWILRGRANSDVENDIGELLNDTASSGWDIFSDGDAERMRWRRKKESKTHSVKSKICKLIILLSWSLL